MNKKVPALGHGVSTFIYQWKSRFFQNQPQSAVNCLMTDK